MAIRTRALTQLAAAAWLSLAASLSHAATTVNYMLWDSMQAQVYQQCAADFERQHPDIHIHFTQVGWSDYWTDLTIDLISGSAPDVFTDHLSHYPQFVDNGLLADLAPYIRRDHLDLSQYPPLLVRAWSHDGKQYGIPKDWDSVALMVNLDDARRAGVTLQQLQQMRWNPVDGGSFETVIRRLTIDRNGHNALDPRFDKSHVEVYGYTMPGSSDMAGQVDWSHFAASNGFVLQPQPWSKPDGYDDPRLAQTLDWLAGLQRKGLSPPNQAVRSLGGSSLFAAGRVAMVADGSWMINYYAHHVHMPNTWVPLPIGPIGQRASMVNDLTDAMWVGSKVKEQAWQWIRYLASRDCQSVVARSAVTFPALRGLDQTVLDVDRQHGIDASAFVEMAHSKTFLTPIASHGNQVNSIMKSTLDSIFLGRQLAAAALAQARVRIDALFARDPND